MPDSRARSAKIDELKGRLQKQPGSRLFLELARELHEAGELERAAQVCSEGVARHPAYLSARVLLGRIHRDMGNLEEARRELETALTSAPDNLLARRLLADICREQGDLDGALERFRALLAFSSRDEEIRATIEEIETELAGAGGGKAGERPAATAEGSTPVPEDLHLATPTLAEIFLQQGLTRRAAEVYREILRGDQGNEEARSRLAEIESLDMPPVVSRVEPQVTPPPPADPVPALDPTAEGRDRAIQALRGWLSAIQKGSRILA